MSMSIPNLLAPETRANPYPLYKQLRDEQPIARVEPGGMYAVSRYDDVVAVLRSPSVFSSAAFRAMWMPAWLPQNPIAGSIVTTDPPEHTRLRGLVSRPFEPRAVTRLEPRVRTFALDLVDNLCRVDEVDFVAEFAAPVPSCVIAEILGLDLALHKNFKRWGDAIANITPITPAEYHDNVRACVTEMESYLRQVIAARRAQPQDDLVSDLLAPGENGQMLTDEEVLAMLFLVLPAGFETAMNLLAHSLRLLSLRPDILATLRGNPARIPAFIEEMLRFEPPVHTILRVALADSVVAGTTIPAGSIVALLLGSANRDERRFAEPDRFDIARDQSKHIAFGYGIHFCIGAALARLEARVALEEIVKRYDQITPVPGELAWNYAITVRGPTKLPLRFHRAAATAS